MLRAVATPANADGVPELFGARVSASTDITAATFPIVVSWDTETFDIGVGGAGFHEGVINPTRFTIPPGVGAVRLTGQVALAPPTTANSVVTINLLKNGSPLAPGIWGESYKSTGGGSTFTAQLNSGPLKVVPGDYFELNVFSGAGVPTPVVVAAANSWFAIEAIG